MERKTIYNILLSAVLLTAGASTRAQSPSASPAIRDILRSIEENNKALKALDYSADAQVLRNRTGIYLEDPEVEYNHLWGSESIRRNDFSVSQEIDLATVLGAKSRLADSQSSMVGNEFKASRMEILLEAHKLCIDVVYCNALIKAMQVRSDDARQILEAQEKMMENGHSGALDRSKARLNLSEANGKLKQVEIERNSALTRLAALNGGQSISLEESVFSTAMIPGDFENWYETMKDEDPALAYAKGEQLASSNSLQVSKMASLPRLKLGYMSELVPNEEFRGVTLGVTVPLWSNRNNVRQAKAQAIASQARYEDTAISQRSAYRELYDRAVRLSEMAAEYRSALGSEDGVAMLKTVLDSGKISLLDYIVEVGLYYDTLESSLLAEKEFQYALADLFAVYL